MSVQDLSLNAYNIFEVLLRKQPVHNIDNYSFGNMTVDGKAYDFDLIITPGKILSDWWRKDGHKLHLEDLEKIIDQAPATLVIGRGAQGVMKVPQSVEQKLSEKGFDVITAKTKEAVKIYNEKAGDTKTIGAFHLTC